LQASRLVGEPFIQPAHLALEAGLQLLQVGTQGPRPHRWLIYGISPHRGAEGVDGEGVQIVEELTLAPLQKI